MASRTGPRRFRIPKRRPQAPVPPPEPERAGSKEEKSDTPIAKAARRLRSNYKEMFVPGQTEYSQVMCKAVTELFTRSVTKTETNKMERVEAVTDLGAILVERFDDLKEAEAEHAHDLERSKEENKELEELSQELGVYDAPEKYTFEKKEAFIIGKYKQRYRDSERSTKRQAVERVSRRARGVAAKAPVRFEKAATGGSKRWCKRSQ